MKCPIKLNRLIYLSTAAVAAISPLAVYGAENIPQKPFGQFALLPEENQWLFTPWYQYSDSQDVWRGSQHENIAFPDHHGFDQNDGMLLVEYGIKKDWAADLNVGYTSLATRAFTVPAGTVQNTSGLMDVTFGLRWQVINEYEADSAWAPTLTLRAGGVYRGNYDHDFPYAPGNGSVGIEPQVMLVKHFGWEGFGMFGTLGYRNFRSGGNDQVFGTIGLNQSIKGFLFSVGYRHQQNTAGFDVGGTDNTIIYSSKVREINQIINCGVGYTTERDWHFQFYLERNIDGRNTTDKETYGVYATFPVGGKKHGAAFVENNK
jgi:hypothetical protein